MVALKDTLPASITSIGAPLPTWWPKLTLRTGYKMLRMHIPGTGIRSREDIIAVGMYDASSTAELTRDPVGNLGRLGRIARFDAVETAVAARGKEIPVSLGYNDGDEYYQLPPNKEAYARLHDVGVIRMPGIHDELIIRPTQTLAAILGIPDPDWSTVEPQ